jgi:hypothetical protein
VICLSTISALVNRDLPTAKKIQDSMKMRAVDTSGYHSQQANCLAIPHQECSSQYIVIGVSQLFGPSHPFVDLTLDSISSHFNVLNMPISTTAPIYAKTHVLPIDGIAQ